MMPPLIIAAGVGAIGAGVAAGVGTAAGAALIGTGLGAVGSGLASKSADDRAEEAAAAGAAASNSTQKQEEVVHRLPVESGAATVSGYQLEYEFQKALRASLLAGNEDGLDFGG
jgi:hypothetical protein